MALALRQSEHAPQLPAPFVSVSEAALRLGCSPGHLRRRCADELAGKGLAKQINGVWGILPAADPRLAQIETWRDRDLRQLARLRREGVRPRYLETAELRRDLVVGFDSFEGPGRNTVDQLAVYLATIAAGGGALAELRCKQRTFYIWKQAYEQPGEDGGLAALVPAYGGAGGDKRSNPIGEAAWAHAANLLNAGNAIRVATAYTLTLGHRRNNGLEGDPAWRMPGLRCFQLEAKRRRPKPLRVLADRGVRAFDGACIPKGQRDYDAIAAGECYVGDEHILDVLVRIPDDRRGWRPIRNLKLTAWIDERSRYIVGWVLAPFANTSTILGALKNAIRDHGAPQRLRSDHGKDYRSAMGSLHAKKRGLDELDAARFSGVVERLGIRLQPATPFMPWAKLIESFFGTLKEHFHKLMTSFIGGSPAERHQDRHAWARKNVHMLPTMAEVRDLLARYIDIYHATPHRGGGMLDNSPAEALAKFRGENPIRHLSEDVLEFTFLSFTKPLVVQRDGIKHLKSWYGWGDLRVVKLQGEEVILGIHPDYAGEAWLCDLERRPLFKIQSERHRFSTKRDAERIAKVRANARAEYSAPARAARNFLIDTPPEQLLDDRAAGLIAQHGDRVAEAERLAARRQPRLVIADPALSNSIRTANEASLETAPRDPDADVVRLEDMLDPFAADAAAIETPADQPSLDPADFLSEPDEEPT